MINKNYDEMKPADKVKFIKDFFDKKNPEYLWYAVGQTHEIQTDKIMDQTECPGDFGSIELHQVYGGGMLGVPTFRKNKPFWMGIANILNKGDIALRVRDPKKVSATLDVNGKQAELYNAAAGNGYKGVNFVTRKAYGPEEKKEIAESHGLEFRIVE